MCGPTVDNQLPVLLLRVLHGVKCLLGDAVQVHIPPVLQHLEGDVGVVDHRPRRLGTNAGAAVNHARTFLIGCRQPCDFNDNKYDKNLTQVV